MSDTQHMESDEKSVRVNVRIPRKQYEMMKRFGDVLGMETDGACVKHFLTVGLQASAGGILSIKSVELNADAVAQLRRMNESMDYVKQLDLVEAAKEAS